MSIKSSIILRYNLLLYFYTKFYEHYLNGIPIIKPMWLKFQSCYRELSELNNAHFVVGNEFIIIPNLNTKQ